MSTRLRQLARQQPDAMTFLATYQRLRRHTPGTGLRELARVWRRAHRVAGRA